MRERKCDGTEERGGRDWGERDDGRSVSIVGKRGICDGFETPILKIHQYTVLPQLRNRTNRNQGQNFPSSPVDF